MSITPSTHRTFADIWQRAVDQHGDRTFLTFRSEHGQIDTWTYREFDLIVDDAVALLTASGVAAGDPVHLCLRNSPAFIAIWLATAELGAWMVPVDPASSSRDIETQLARVSPKIGFYAAERADTYLAGVAEGTALRTVALEETAADVQSGGRLRADDVAPHPPVAAAPVEPSRPSRRDVHVRHHRAAEGRRVDPGQLLPRR